MHSLENEGHDFPTPALIVDLDVFERNVAKAEGLIRGTGKLLRPHVKTHRTPGLALRQLGPIASGVTCATVGEAEVMVNAGIQDVLLANEVVTPDKIRRIASLAARVFVAVDSEEPVLALSAAAMHAGTTVHVLVDVDIGLGRCGVRDIPTIRELAVAVARTPGLRFSGLMGYEGRFRASVSDRAIRIARAFDRLGAAKSMVESAGLEVGVVSAAGTSTIVEALRDPTITEIQAGTYALMEPDLEGLGLPFECAVYVLASVISRSEGVVVLDAGRHTVGYDYGLPISLNPSGQTKSIADEHVVLEWVGSLPSLGARIRLRPSQNRTTFNLYNHVWLVRNERVVDKLPIEARGSSG